MNRLWLWAGIGILFLIVVPASAQDPGGRGKAGILTIVIDGFPNDNGSARIGLCNSAEGFKNDHKILDGEALPIVKGKATWILRDLPWGKYALKVYHDENGNGKLDKNVFGVPKEAYGFSSDARGTFGAPDFEKAAFTFDKAQMTVRISVK